MLEQQIEKCDVVLAIIGHGWLDARNESGERRLESSEDFVRIEIASALRFEKLVIPVLVNGARMPQAEQLPEDLKLLARRNALRLTHERFRSNAEGLIKVLRGALDEIEVAEKVLSNVETTKVPAEQTASDVEQQSERSGDPQIVPTSSPSRAEALARVKLDSLLQGESKPAIGVDRKTRDRVRLNRPGVAAISCFSTALLVSFVAIWIERPRIENDLTRRSMEQLRLLNLQWAEVSVTGRDVLLRGRARFEPEQRRPSNEVSKIWGVRMIEDRITLIDPSEGILANKTLTLPAGVVWFSLQTFAIMFCATLMGSWAGGLARRI